MIGLIKRNFNYLNKNTFLTLYKALVRPHLEYLYLVSIQKRLILSIENVQRIATEIIKNIKHLTYEERLRYLDLPTLVNRRSRGDMIETYKIANGK